jgi:hypothetical protein
MAQSGGWTAVRTVLRVGLDMVRLVSFGFRSHAQLVAENLEVIGRPVLGGAGL